MQDLAPVENQRLFILGAQKFQIGLICERTCAVGLADPHRDRGAVGDQAESLFTFAQRLLRHRQIGDVDMGTDQAQRLPIRTTFDPGLGRNPPDLPIDGPDDSILRRKMLCGPAHGIEEIPQRAGTVLRVQPSDPVLMGVVDLRRQTVDRPVLRRATFVAKAVLEVDRDHGYFGQLVQDGGRTLAIRRRSGSDRLGSSAKFVLAGICHFRTCLGFPSTPHSSAIIQAFVYHRKSRSPDRKWSCRAGCT